MPSGAIDYIHRTRDILDAYGSVWIHVDAASGGVYSGDEKFISKYGDILGADSFIVDPSKWLFMSYGVGILFLKDTNRLVNNYSSNIKYWKDDEEHDNFKISINGTRPWRTLGLYMILKTCGSKNLRVLVNSLINLADYIEESLISNGFDVIRASDLPIILFSHKNWLDYVVNQICDSMIKSNIAYFTVAKFKEKDYLRISVNNYQVTREIWNSILNKLLDIIDERGELSDKYK